MHKLIIIILVSFQFVSLKSQNSINNDDIIHHFDSLYGADNLLINGRLFTYSNFRAKGDPFFFGKDFKQSTVFINQRKYSDLWVNYDIVDDKLILSALVNDNEINIELNNHLIDSFYISHFVNTKNESVTKNPHLINPDYKEETRELLFTKKFINTELLGYIEVIETKDYQLMIKYKKRFLNKVSEENPYGEFTDQAKNLYLIKNKERIDVTKTKDFLNAFKKNKKGIKGFLKKNKIKYKKAEFSELNELMKFCQKLN